MRTDTLLRIYSGAKFVLLAVPIFLIAITSWICFDQLPAYGCEYEDNGDHINHVNHYTLGPINKYSLTNLIIEAAEQNKDTCITEIDEVLYGNYLQYPETYGGQCTLADFDVMTNLRYNLCFLIYKRSWEFLFENPVACLNTLSCVSVMVMLLGVRVRSRGLARSGARMIPLIFVIGFILGPLFMCPLSELTLVKIHLELTIHGFDKRFPDLAAFRRFIIGR